MFVEQLDKVSQKNKPTTSKSFSKYIIGGVIHNSNMKF